MVETKAIGAAAANGVCMGEVADFEKQLIKQAGRRFAQWRQIDLHNHTPASFDYQGDQSSALDDTAEDASPVITR